jgi:hypothetical protein
MKANQLPHNLGQSVWLDNPTRGLLNAFVKFWNELLAFIESRSTALTQAA